MRSPLPAERLHRGAVVLLGLCVVAVELSLVVGSATGATDAVTLPASADTYIRSGAPDTNEGGSTFLRLRASGDNRALVRFDQAVLVQTVGSGNLVSAALELDVTDNGDNWGSSGRTISAFRLTSDWAEGNGFVDQGLPPNRGTGSGATWECAVDSDISDQGKDCSGATDWEMGKPNQPELHPWVEPATASALITNGLGGTISFDVTADVQAFLSSAAANYGWIMKKDLEGPSGLVEFASRETGAGPRLVLTLDQASADTTPPVVDATGLSSFAPRGEFTNGQGETSLAVTSWDTETGIARVSLETAGGSELASASGACSPACPASFDTELSFDVSSLSGGRHDLRARARDGAANNGEGPTFALWVDRGAPSAPTGVRVARYESTVTTFAWSEASDPPLAGGDPGSGVHEYEYRYRIGAGTWSELLTTDITEFDVSDAALGDIVDVEVSAIDAVGNVGQTTSATLTVFAASEPLPWHSDPGSNPAPQVTLTPAQVASVSSAALEDPRIAGLLEGLSPQVDEVLPWSTAFTTSSIVGADVTLTWNTPVTLETDWPLASFAEDGQSYTLDAVHFRATSVLSLDVLVTLDPLEVVAFDVIDGDVDPDSIEFAGPSPLRVRALAAGSDTPEGASDDRNAYNVYRLSNRILPGLGSDVFWNWDFRRAINPIVTDPSEHADWPVALIFTGQVSVDVAKLIWSGRSFQNPMWALAKDGGPHQLGRTTTTGNVWDRDEGAYLGRACIGHKWHYRAYAPAPQNSGDDRMYNLEWGYYVIATIHQDHHDPDPGPGNDPLIWRPTIHCFPGPWHGGTDKAEAKLADAAELYNGPSGFRFDALSHWRYLHNYDERGRRGRRVYDSDGWATRICGRFGDGHTPCLQE